MFLQFVTIIAYFLVCLFVTVFFLLLDWNFVKKAFQTCKIKYRNMLAANKYHDKKVEKGLTPYPNRKKTAIHYATTQQKAAEMELKYQQKTKVPCNPNKRK